MEDNCHAPAAINYFLKPGFIFLATRTTVISTVLGSCVAVCLYDKKRKVGGMNHFQLPYIGNGAQSTARYGNVATIALLRMIIQDGSEVRDLEAQVLGGAYNPKIALTNIGDENVGMARKILAGQRVQIASEDVGGERGRKVLFNTTTNEVAIVKVDKLRKEDWYPYDGSR